MKQMSLSEVCKMYGFTRRVIQGYEKEGLIKHSGRNKYGYLLYSEDEVKKISELRTNGMSVRHIAELYGVSVKTIYSILSGKRWKHTEFLK